MSFSTPSSTLTEWENVMPARRVKAIRTALARSPKEFEARFGIPARTIEDWEQGRKLDVAASILMTVIEKEPEVAAAAGKT